MRNIFRYIKSNPAFGITLILFAGLMFSPNQLADIGGIKEAGSVFASSGKSLRLITVLVSALIAAAFVGMRGSSAIRPLFSGPPLLLTLYGLLAIATVVFSKLWAMTLFKGAEIVVASLICSLIIASRSNSHNPTLYLKGVFWVYVISVFTALLELVIVGSGGHKQLVQAGPLLSTMMESAYPPMVGNALGFLGALVGLFALYLYDSSKNHLGAKLFAAVIFLAGFTVLFLSYTRSILVFFVLGVIIYYSLQRSFKKVTAIVLCCVVALAIPPVQERILEHMKRGSSDAQLQSLSGRTNFWSNVTSRNPMKIIVGEGFGTGARLKNYDKSGEVFRAGNEHNSIAEILMSSGALGALLWLFLMAKIAISLRRRSTLLRSHQDRDMLRFHNFLVAVFVVSALRTLMNSSFVYLDYFLFILIGFAAYSVSPVGISNLASNSTRAPRKTGLLVGHNTKAR